MPRCATPVPGGAPRRGPPPALPSGTPTWNGTSWAIGPSPNHGSPSVLTSVSTAPGDAIVQAVGYDGTSGSWNPLAMQNG